MEKRRLATRHVTQGMDLAPYAWGILRRAWRPARGLDDGLASVIGTQVIYTSRNVSGRLDGFVRVFKNRIFYLHVKLCPPDVSIDGMSNIRAVGNL